jgi:hypothetical protein
METFRSDVAIQFFQTYLCPSIPHEELNLPKISLNTFFLKYCSCKIIRKLIRVLTTSNVFYRWQK